MKDLIAKIEAATSPSYALEFEIAKKLNLSTEAPFPFPFMASLDAAITIFENETEAFEKLSDVLMEMDDGMITKWRVTQSLIIKALELLEE